MITLLLIHQMGTLRAASYIILCAASPILLSLLIPSYIVFRKDKCKMLKLLICIGDHLGISSIPDQKNHYECLYISCLPFPSYPDQKDHYECLYIPYLPFLSYRAENVPAADTRRRAILLFNPGLLRIKLFFISRFILGDNFPCFRIYILRYRFNTRYGFCINSQGFIRFIFHAGGNIALDRFIG